MHHTLPSRAAVALPLLLCALAAGASYSSAWAAAPVPTQAGAYSRRWFTIDSGGLTASSQQPSGYRLGGTVGQPDAQVSSGAGYRLIGGFWSGIAPTGSVGVPDETLGAPTAFRALPPLPNPAAGRVAIGFELPRSCEVAVRILDLQGRPSARAGPLAP